MNETEEFFKQLNEWSILARAKLKVNDFPAVSRMLFHIRGTSFVFGYFQIAYLTGLGEAVSSYVIQKKNSRTVMKKCIDCIWDVLTTLEFMIANGIDNTTDEQKILIYRLEATLKSFRDYKPSLTQSEIDIIVRSFERQRDLARQGLA